MKAAHQLNPRDPGGYNGDQLYSEDVWWKEDDLNEDERGRVTWHSSEEDGGPDVGLSLGLGSGFSFYVGEVAVSTLEEHGIDVKETGDGWWIVLWGPKDTDTRIAGKVIDIDDARAVFDKLAEVLAP